MGKNLGSGEEVVVMKRGTAPLSSLNLANMHISTIAGSYRDM